jgi:hypothetical protein
VQVWCSRFVRCLSWRRLLVGGPTAVWGPFLVLPDGIRMSEPAACGIRVGIANGLYSRHLSGGGAQLGKHHLGAGVQSAAGCRIFSARLGCSSKWAAAQTWCAVLRSSAVICFAVTSRCNAGPNTIANSACSCTNGTLCFAALWQSVHVACRYACSWAGMPGAADSCCAYQSQSTSGACLGPSLHRRLCFQLRCNGAISGTAACCSIKCSLFEGSECCKPVWSCSLALRRMITCSIPVMQSCMRHCDLCSAEAGQAMVHVALGSRACQWHCAGPLVCCPCVARSRASQEQHIKPHRVKGSAKQQTMFH